MNIENILNFDDLGSIKDFIKNSESSLYGGKNEDGEIVNIMVEQGVGMTVRTYQYNNWVRVDEYNSEGDKELETFEGRWK